MSVKYSQYTNRNAPVPQSMPIPGEEHKMTKNSAGGYVYQLDDWKRLDRFLVLGTEGGTFYVSERKLTSENIQNVKSLILNDGIKVVDRVVEISDSGRAPNNDPALLVLAACASYGDPKTKQHALSNLSKVARIGTHLFHFAEYINGMRGWGRQLRSSVANWYEQKTADDLVQQVTKYQSRDGWSHRDLLRLSHVGTKDESKNVIYRWVTSPDKVTEFPVSLRRLEAIVKLLHSTNEKEAINLIKEYNLPREVVPTQMLTSKDVWSVLLETMPIHATLRNLGKMTEVGLLSPLSNSTKSVLEKFSSEESIAKSRLHPIDVIKAWFTYRSGHGMKGKLTWTPVQSIVGQLEKLFYSSFKSIRPTGKNFLLGLDISGSMTGGEVAGVTGFSPNIAAAVMAMVTARSEKNYHIMGFANTFKDLNINASMDLNDVMRRTRELSFGSTDCSLPMQYALKEKLDVDSFVVYTDNETWAGLKHPVQALREYRTKMHKNSKLIVVGMTATECSIADPSDPGMLDVVGFDTVVPSMISDFSRE